MMILWFCITISLLSHLVTGYITCLNQTGQFVDWFIIFKIPRSPFSKSFFTRKGYGYAYLDNTSPSLRFQEKSIGHNGSGLGRTLAQLYGNFNPPERGEEKSKRKPDFAYLMYNNEDPSGNHEWLNKGIAKGVLMFDNSTGFWLVHSVPGFPPFSERGYDFPQSARNHGHIFLCVSVDVFTIDAISSSFLYNVPHFYDWYIPAVMATWVPNLVAVVAGKSVAETSRWWNTQRIRSIRGEHFTYFVKSSYFLHHIYRDIIASYYNSFLLVKSATFVKRSTLLKRCILEYVTKLSVEGVNADSVEAFSYLLDKSEWVVSKAQKDALFCFGGIQKQEWLEAAGSLCLTNRIVWSAFFKIIHETQGCPQLITTHVPNVPP